MIYSKCRITNRKRFFTFLASTFIIITAIIVVFLSNSRVYSSTYKHVYKEVLVKEGDTLWNIAIENMPAKYDVRKMIFEIREFNNMADVDIYPGDLIKIPIKHSNK